MNMQLSVMSTEHALKEWHVLEGFLAKSLPYAAGRVTVDYWREMVEQQLGLILIAWAPEEGQLFAVFYCEITTHPSGVKVFSIGSCGGVDVDLWGTQLWPAFVEVARAYQCDQLEVTGRRGWRKFIDARELATIYVKQLRPAEEVVNESDEEPG